MDDCNGCHAGKAIGKVKPVYHDAAWGSQHGPSLKAGKTDAMHGGKCASCHEPEKFCMPCHQTKRAISHAEHLGDRGADCEMCHNGVAADGFPKLSLDECSSCHDGEFQAKTIKARGRKLDVKFPHAAHTKKVKECKTCHAATLEDRQVASEPLVAEKQCWECHDDRDVKVAMSACTACHGYDRKRAMPKDHKQNWRVRHGLESRRRFEDEHGQDCAQCHTKSKCVSCHQSTAPMTHTGLWRTRTHGVAAGFDRATCKTCHETGTCVGCHQRTAPISHRGAWESTHGIVAASKSNDRCLVCHQQSYCTQCHLGQGGGR
jgi:c(7)-type cytochrome triheme protein